VGWEVCGVYAKMFKKEEVIVTLVNTQILTLTLFRKYVECEPCNIIDIMKVLKTTVILLVLFFIFRSVQNSKFRC